MISPGVEVAVQGLAAVPVQPGGTGLDDGHPRLVLHTIVPLAAPMPAACGCCRQQSQAAMNNRGSGEPVSAVAAFQAMLATG